jgi:hypothetical protein
MNRHYFGTDGVRGAYGGPVINEGFAARLGRAAGEWAAARCGGTGRAVIGRDPRSSGASLAAAVGAGLQAAGWSVEDLGVLPTPAVARAAQGRGAFGVVVTAFVVFAAWLACQLFAGRAAFLLVGAMLATAMSANVFFVIIPIVVVVPVVIIFFFVALFFILFDFFPVFVFLFFVVFFALFVVLVLDVFFVEFFVELLYVIFLFVIVFVVKSEVVFLVIVLFHVCPCALLLANGRHENEGRELALVCE